MLKSLLISTIYFPPQVGGISYFMKGVAGALGPERVCCLTAVVKEDGADSDGSEPRVYRQPALLSSAYYSQAVAWGASLIRIMLREHPQLVQCATISEARIGMMLQQWLNLPYIVYAHGNEILALAREEWKKPRISLLRAGRVIANSQFTKNAVQKLGVDPDRIATLHPGCDVDFFRPLSLPVSRRQELLRGNAERRVILTVGNLVERKGHDVVIKALPLVRESVPDVVYLVVGEGPYRPQLESLALKLGVGDSVIFAGQLRDESLPEIYSVCDVFVMASREQPETCDVEGFGMVFIEASACGKPAVGGRSGGIPDAVVEGVTGLLVDPQDPTDIANAIKRILTDRELANRMGSDGRARAEREFNWTYVGQRVQEVLENMVRDRRVRPRSTNPGDL